MGFLNAHREIPQADGKTRTEAKTRLQKYIDAGVEPPMPKLVAGDYLVQAMLALGPTRPMPMGGDRAADWPEIAAYAMATRDVGDAWEVTALRDMCEAFARGLASGSNIYGKPPMERG